MCIRDREWPERDETGIPFITIDPPGSMDLDQAVHIERSGEGFRVRYAIAYLPAFVAPGGAIDIEAQVRGQTIYAPDQRTPLHPAPVSEDLSLIHIFPAGGGAGSLSRTRLAPAG